MLFKIAFKNIKKSIKDYAVYFFTLVLGVAIFYVFNSMESSSSIVMLNESKLNIVGILIELLSYLSIFVVVVLGCLIVYASRFLMKRRKKEFGIYMLLGMSKRSIANILLWETVIIGFLSLCVGLGVGILLSQFMSLFIAGLFEADMSQYTFTFSYGAFIKTLIFFAVIYVGVMFLYTLNISKTKLITLIQANKQNETFKMKNTWVCLIVFIIAVAMLAYAYWIVTANISELRYFSDLGKPVILGIIGTILFFYSLSGFVLRVAQSSKRFYNRNINMFVVRQLHAKANTTVVSMSVISLMLFVTICVLSSGLAMNQSMTQDLKEYAPADFTFEIFSYEEEAFKNTDVLRVFNEKGLDEKEVLSKYEIVTTYTDPELTYAETVPGYKGYGLLEDYIEYIVPISQYNDVAKIFGQPTYQLNKDEYIVIADFDAMSSMRNDYLTRGKELTIGNTKLKSRYDECKPGFVDMAPSPMNTGIYLVPDKVSEQLQPYSQRMVGNYKVQDEKEIAKLEEQIMGHFEGKIEQNSNYMTTITTKKMIYESSIGLGAVTTFIGLYLGVIFLISSAAVLALKELSDSSDNKERYAILRKIGVDEKMINHSLRTQIAIFFFTPLALAIVHSFFGIKFASLLLPIRFDERILLSIFFTALFLVIIYGGYFFVTYLTSKKIIQEK